MREGLLSQLKVGDYCKHRHSSDGFYEVVSLEHPRYGSGHLELRYVSRGHLSAFESSFEFYKDHFNKEFPEIVSTAQQRELSQLASLLIQVNASGDVSEIHELLFKLEI